MHPNLVFAAPLANNLIPGAGTMPPGVCTRSTIKTTSNGGGLISAAANTPAFELIGGRNYLALAPGMTNKCTNYNANPDAGLTNVTKSGDAAAVLSRVDDSAALAAAGLSGICTSGYVYKLDNSAGSTDAQATFGGTAGNTNTHIMSVYLKGGTGRLSCNGGDRLTITASATYRGLVSTSFAATAPAQFSIIADAGQVLYFILNQLEESPVATAPIVTAGASAARSADAVTFPISSIAGGFPQTAGTAMVAWRPKFAQSNIGTAAFNIFGVNNSTGGMLCHASGRTTTLSSSDGTNEAQTSALAWSADTLYYLATQWNNSGVPVNSLATGKMRVGYSTDLITWTWGTAANYDGAFTLGTAPNDKLFLGYSTAYPHWIRNVRLYNAVLSTDEINREFANAA